jgi:HlyD family secretion protein
MTEASELGRPPSDHRPEAPSGRNGPASLSDRVRSLRLQDRPAGGSRGGALPWALSAILLLTTAAFGYYAYRVTPAAPGPDAPADKGGTGAAPSAGSVASSGEVVLQAKGYIVPVHQIQVSPKVGGMIVWLHERFEEGSHFKEGEVLARLEDVDYKARRDYAQHFLDAAKRRLEELERNWPEEIAQLRAKRDEAEEIQRQADRDLKRGVEAGVSTTRNEVEKLRSSLDTAKCRFQDARIALKLMEEGPRKDKIEAAKAEVRQAKANLDEAQWRLDNCVIRAPISGTMLTKKAEKGNIVNPVAFNISASLCDMADLSDVEVDLRIQERDIANVVKGQRCTVMPEAYEKHEPFRQRHPNGYDGRVSRLMPNADRSNGSVPVRVKLKVFKEEEGVYLKPDLGVLVKFLKPDES